jgi:hypothetical protein
MPKKLTTETFIVKAQVIHGTLYDYSLVNYLGTAIKVKIICNVHGMFEQIPNSHLSGKGCLECARDASSNKICFISKAIEIHGNVYDYGSVVYINNYTPVQITCTLHGIFEQAPSNHLKGSGCASCIFDKWSLSNDEFQNKAKEIHQNKYDYSLTHYNGWNNYVDIICPEHGMFSQTGGSHLNGCGCPKCKTNISKIEILWLDSLNIKEELRHKTIKINGQNYMVDAYDPSTKTIYEFYGDYWHGNPKKFISKDINKTVKKSFGHLYDRTIQREILFHNNGYKIISVWENDFRSSLKVK